MAARTRRTPVTGFRTPASGWSVGPALVLALLATAAPVHAQLPHNIPDFCATTTISSVASGPWSSPATWSPARVPGPNDAVGIAPGTTVTYDAWSDAAFACVGVRGTITFRTDASTRLTAGTVIVYAAGELRIGTEDAPVNAAVTAEVVIADRALDPVADPEQFGTGLIVLGRIRTHGAVRNPAFVRTGVEPRAGQTTLTLAQPAAGWRIGDRLVVPDTRQLQAGERFANLSPEFEELTLTAITGPQVTVNRPLTYHHEGARNVRGVLEYLPHVANLTRNVVIRSANPAGTRGHTIYVHRADVDVRYTLFKDLGRTTNENLGPSNQMGRYPLHLHHVMGPANPSDTGHQYRLIGNAIADSRKWPLTVHNTHFGLIQDNVVFNGLGSGFVTEDGNESFNEWVRNFGAAIFGDQNPRDMDGRDGSIFWLNGFNHRLRENVAANAVNRSQAIVNGAGYNFTWTAASRADTRIPRFRGADTTASGEYRLVNMQFVPIPEFTRNEAYGAMPTGLVVWNLGTDGYDTSTAMGETVFRDFLGWHLHESAFFGYPAHNVTFDGWVVRGHPRARGIFDGGTGWWSGDYKVRNPTIRRADIQGMSNGIDASTATEGTFTIQDSYLSNLNDNIGVPTLATPGTGATPAARTIIVQNTRFEAMPSAGRFRTISKDWSLERGNSHPDVPDNLFVYDYDQITGDSFRVYYPEQATENIAGGLASCTTTRPEIRGLVCAETLPPPPPPPPPGTLDTDGDGLPDDWETGYGLNPNAPAGTDGPTGDPDGDGRTNLDEYTGGTHPRGFATRYLAEGAINSFFQTEIALLNVGSTAAITLVRIQPEGQAERSYRLTVPARTRRTLNATTLALFTDAPFSTVVESDAPLVVDRTMSWDASGYGSHAEASIAGPSTTWFLAEGSTSADFSLFYLLQNPNPATVTASVRFLRPGGQPPIDRAVTLPPLSRTTIPVDDIAPLASTDVSGVVTASAPIIVERAMYLSRPGQPFAAGHESAGVTAPALQWFLAEGATGPFFELFILVANPNDAPASITADYLLATGATISKSYTVPAQSRFTIWADEEQFPDGSGNRALANVAVSVTLRSTNAVPIIVERSMWWPQPIWYEAHNSPGTTVTGTRWALAAGEIGGSAGTETYVLVANTSAAAGQASVTLHFEDGTTAAETVSLGANSRTTIAVSQAFPTAAGRRFGAVVQSLGATPVQIVVERAMYTNGGGVLWSAGTAAVATRLAP